ncbi:hypothetical protein TWF569_001448 [Orbilia oligospora]|nr:hypothetical protein TWF706_010151 [Orbilia oligospora]KAF3153853.1 hypothetical protein TWF569_001448 [Orbilia oligospora]
MSDSTPEVPEATTPSDASLAQMTPLSVSEQARIRRELRKAKVGQGADRLRKITQTQRSAAGFQEDYKNDDVDISPSPAPRATVENISDQELDVSDHFYQPNNRPRDVPNRILPPTPPSQSEFSLDEDQLAQMMQAGGLFGAPPQPGASPFGAGPPQGMESDPLLQMMQQMLGGAGGMPGMPPPGAGAGAGGAGAGGLPPDLLSAMLGGAAGPEQPAPQESRYTKWWAFLHILCSVVLGVYAVLSLPQRYTGTKEERIQHEGAQKIPLFWYFATMELLLQSTRYLLVERGGPPPGIILTTISRFLPPPLGTALITFSHYIKLFSTVWQDALIVVFTIGFSAWVNTWFVVDDELPLMP